MAVGHVTLDGREYTLTDPRQLNRSNANQVSAKLGSSAGDYDDLQEWSAFVMDDWRTGVGQKDPEAGGFLFSTADTRYEGQVEPPALFEDDFQNIHYSVGYTGNHETITIGSTETYKRAGFRFPLLTTETFRLASVYLPGSAYEGTATQVQVELWSSVGAVPNALIEANTVTLVNDHGHFWYTVDFVSIGPPGVTTTYYLVVYPVSGTLTLQITDATNDGEYYNGSAWVANAQGDIRALIHPNAPSGSITHIEHFDSTHTYFSIGAKLYKWNRYLDLNPVYVLLKTYATDITDLLSIGSKIYIGLGDTTNYDTYNGTVFTAGTVPARLFALWNGLLWRATTTDIHYTADEALWVTVSVADTGYAVRGMSGFQNDIIVSTDNSLYRVTSGDVVISITKWGAIDNDNGKYMLNFQGNLYISQKQSILRYDGASMLPFGPDLGEGLPQVYSGDIIGMVANNNWFICAIQSIHPTEYLDSVWVHNGQGWHCIGIAPSGVHITSIGYNVTENAEATASSGSRVRLGTNMGFLPGFRVPDFARSRFADDVGNQNYINWEMFSSLETDWFYGSLREVRKDWESVYLDVEYSNASTWYVDVYWKDDDSTNWELLGRIDTPGEELRWSNTGTRPNSRKIKIKFLLVTTSTFYGFRIIAARVKYRPMVMDRWRWDVPIMVNEDQIFLDGTVQTTYTIAQQIAHLDGLTTQVPPFPYIDVNGVSYDVMVVNAVRNIEEFDYYNSGKQLQYNYLLTLEQVHA